MVVICLTLSQLNSIQFYLHCTFNKGPRSKSSFTKRYEFQIYKPEATVEQETIQNLENNLFELTLDIAIVNNFIIFYNCALCGQNINTFIYYRCNFVTINVYEYMHHIYF